MKKGISQATKPRETEDEIIDEEPLLEEEETEEKEDGSDDITNIGNEDEGTGASSEGMTVDLELTQDEDEWVARVKGQPRGKMGRGATPEEAVANFEEKHYDGPQGGFSANVSYPNQAGPSHYDPYTPADQAVFGAGEGHPGIGIEDVQSKATTKGGEPIEEGEPKTGRTAESPVERGIVNPTPAMFGGREVGPGSPEAKRQGVVGVDYALEDVGRTVSPGKPAPPEDDDEEVIVRVHQNIRTTRRAVRLWKSGGNPNPAGIDGTPEPSYEIVSVIKKNKKEK